MKHSGIDMMLGSGGVPEGVLAAAALKSLEGDFRGKLLPQSHSVNNCMYDGMEEVTNSNDISPNHPNIYRVNWYIAFA